MAASPTPSSSSTLLEIIIISAEDLRVGRHSRPVEKDAFVTVRTGPHDAAATAPDRDGGSCPTWNERLLVGLPSSARSIRVEVGCRKQHGGTVPVPVAAAAVPVAEFSHGPAGYLHLLSYRLRDGEGRRNGIVNFSVRRVVKRGGGGGGGGGNHDHHHHYEEAGHVVMGYPVVGSCGGRGI
ncbi:BON1-associated protein 2-like [Ananas comosus]|uniref:BON1-associated protein 2-like n=1 Tax=Ananas comosus TaxID=4615 RepID=A0A6P5H4G6_ANACO|nr:BON1-associated protein 2-like [Ananas comosus]